MENLVVSSKTMLTELLCEEMLSSGQRCPSIRIFPGNIERWSLSSVAPMCSASFTRHRARQPARSSLSFLNSDISLLEIILDNFDISMNVVILTIDLCSAVVLMGSTSLRARSPHGAAVLMGSTSLRARGPHGAAVLMGPTTLGARSPYALVVLTALQSSWAPRP